MPDLPPFPDLPGVRRSPSGRIKRPFEFNEQDYRAFHTSTRTFPPLPPLPSLSSGSRRRAGTTGLGSSGLSDLPPLPPLPPLSSSTSSRYGTSGPSNLSGTRPPGIVPLNQALDDPFGTSSTSSSSRTTGSSRPRPMGIDIPRMSSSGFTGLRSSDPILSTSQSRSEMRRDMRKAWEEEGELFLGMVDGENFESDDEGDSLPSRSALPPRGRRRSNGMQHDPLFSGSTSRPTDLLGSSSSSFDPFGNRPATPVGGTRSRRNSTSSLSGGLSGLNLNNDDDPFGLPSLGSAPRGGLPTFGSTSHRARTGGRPPLRDYTDTLGDLPFTPTASSPQTFRWPSSSPQGGNMAGRPPVRQPWGYGPLPSSIPPTLPPMSPPLTGTRGTGPRWPEFDRSTSTFAPLPDSPPRGRPLRRRTSFIDINKGTLEKDM